MHIHAARIVAGIAAGILAVSAMAQLKWGSDYKAAVAQAKASNRPVLVGFYASWDPWGKKLDSETFVDKDALKVAGKFIPIKVDVEKGGKELADRFHIGNYPTLLFLDKNEKVIGTIDGFEDASEFVKHANTFLKDYADFPGAESKYAKNPKDLSAITRLGVIYANRYEINMALAKLKEAEALDPKNSDDKLSDLYNAIADHYQNASQFTPAIKYFQKAADTSKVTDKRAYGYLSIAACYFTMANPEEPGTMEQKLGYLKLAIPSIEACLKLPGLKAEDRKLAQDYLSAAKRATQGDGDQG